MKRRAFLKELTQEGCKFHRHGGRHDLYINPANGRKAPVPRHSELRNSMCRLIRQQLGLE